VSSYPAPVGAFGGIVAISEATNLPVGYSDHLEDLDAAVYLPSWGCCLFEKHLTYDRNAAGPDHAASLEPEGFNNYTKFVQIGTGWGIQFPLDTKVPHLQREEFEKERTDLNFNRDELVGKLEKTVLDCERDVREVSRQSLVSTRALRAGDVLTREMLTIKRPGTGTPPFMLDELIGRTLARDVEMDVPIVREDVE